MTIEHSSPTIAETVVESLLQHRASEVASARMLWVTDAEYELARVTVRDIDLALRAYGYDVSELAPVERHPKAGRFQAYLDR